MMKMKDVAATVAIVGLGGLCIVLPLIVGDYLDLAPVTNSRCMNGVVEVLVDQPDESSQWWSTKAPCGER